ncbi:MAG: DUF4410 domain-containing protein [Proteobacteria bacterium]|nr:DUF4410 domain-containing protein [Pseudomonadota bacterium]
MRPIHAALAAAVLLAGCAGSVSAPTALQPLSVEQRAALHLSNVTADAASDVSMSDADFSNICDKVKADIQTGSPGVWSQTPGATLKLHFTKFDRGNAFARFMLIGLGQIRIEATVDVVDASGATVAQYKVAKDFALGGIAGGTTTVEDVETGFAKSVAEVVKTQA